MTQTLPAVCGTWLRQVDGERGPRPRCTRSPLIETGTSGSSNGCEDSARVSGVGPGAGEFGSSVLAKVSQVFPSRRERQAHLDGGDLQPPDRLEQVPHPAGRMIPSRVGRATSVVAATSGDQH